MIDGRWGGVRESLENQTMNMAKAAAELIEKNLVFYDKENLIVRHDYVKLAREILRLCM